MSDAKHTPEPWMVEKPEPYYMNYCYQQDIRAKTGYPAKVLGPTIEECKANGERLTVTVNACAGINPEAIPELINALGLAEATIQRLKDQGRTKAVDGTLSVISAALAKAKGGES